jgi:polyphenol oxidase
VKQNRRLLAHYCQLPNEPFWLQQVHGCEVAQIGKDVRGCAADAVYSDQAGDVCVVLTADCLPLLLTDRDGCEVCAVHAGWRGLAGGVIERALACMQAPAESILAWMGPAIGASAFEVGEEVRQVFVSDAEESGQAFIPGRPGHWLADIYLLAKLRLMRAGVGFIGGGDYCTVTDSKRFYSYRRDGRTGRMASLIWLEESL